MDTATGRRCVATVTTATPRTRVRLTATMGLAGFPADCLLALARGMAGDGLGAGVVGVVVVGVTDAAVGATGTAFTVGAASTVGME
jgi:hypothetical protein